jgi:trans-2,3-dihydro-3-hydroxyanthranilate isomerase
MKSLPIYQVDAFTDRPFTGNPAAVVPDARGLSDAQMQAIAREMNLSETAFVYPPEDGRPHRFRWFTPTIEVEFCGHATLATTHVLATTGRLGAFRGGRIEFPVDALIGKLAISVEERAGRAPLIMIGVPIAAFEPAAPALVRDFVAAMGAREADLDPSLPALRYRRKVFIPLRTLEAMRGLRPDFGRILALGREHDISPCPFTLETVDPANAVHLRYFASISGIDEDPVTGAANAPLGAYLATQGLFGKLELAGRARALTKNPTVWRYTAEQGDECGRPGRPVVEVTADGSAVRVGGEAVTILEGALTLP